MAVTTLFTYLAVITVVQLTLAATALAAVLSAAPRSVEVLRGTGVCILVALAAAQFRRERVPAATGPRRTGRLVVLGFVTSAANPTAVLFFAAVLPSFLDTTRAVP